MDEINNLQYDVENGFVKNITHNSISYLQGTVDRIKKDRGFIINFIENLSGGLFITDTELAVVKVRKCYNTVKYTTLMEMDVPVLLGLSVDKVSFIELSMFDKKIMDEIVNDLIGNLDKIDTILAKFIGDQDIRLSFIPVTNDLSALKKFSSDVSKFLSAGFNKNSVTDSAKYKELFKNNGELFDSSITIGEADKIMTNSKTIKFNKIVIRIEGRIDALLELMTDHKEDITVESLNRAIDAVTTLAEYITTVANSMVLHRGLKDTILVISKKMCK